MEALQEAAEILGFTELKFGWIDSARFLDCSDTGEKSKAYQWLDAYRITSSVLWRVLSGWRAHPVRGRFLFMSTSINPYRGFRFPAA
ncbi:hypothetical protein, partial [Azospirillum brasilense]|uniref:hypothetical protein n=1 Tax=Azospirillum brasilense TaxID=192 RepID=UPI001A909085